MAAEHEFGGHLARGAHRRDVVDQRSRPRSSLGLPPAAGRSPGWTRCATSRWSPAEQDPARLVDRRRGRTGCGRAGANTRSSRSRNFSVSPSRSGRVTSTGGAEGAGRRPRPRRARSPGRRARRGAASPPARRRRRRRRCAGNRPATAPAARTRRPPRPSAGEDLEQADVVHVLVGEHDQLEVLDPAPSACQRALERVQDGAGVRAGVDQRQRLVLDQIAVDRRRPGTASGSPGSGSRRAAAAPAPVGVAGALAPLTRGSARAPRRGGAPCPRARPATPGTAAAAARCWRRAR